MKLRNVLIPLLLSLAACGGPAADDYLGLWATSGTTNLAGTTSNESGDKVISHGLLPSDLKLKWNQYCEIPLKVDIVDGSKASVDTRAAPCTYTDSDKNSVKVTYAAGEAHLKADRSEISFSGSAIATTTPPGGTATDKALSFNWVLKKQK